MRDEGARSRAPSSLPKRVSLPPGRSAEPVEAPRMPMSSALDPDLDPVPGFLPPGDDVSRSGFDIPAAPRADVDLPGIVAFDRLHRPGSVRQAARGPQAGGGL